MHGRVHAHRPDPALPGDDRLGREGELGDEVQVEAALPGDAALRHQRPEQLVVRDVGMALRVADDPDPEDAGLLEVARVEDLRRLVELADRRGEGPGEDEEVLDADAARSASMRRSVGRSGTARAARCGTGRIPASATERATATVSAHGVFGRNVRYTAVPGAGPPAAAGATAPRAA